LDSELSKFGFLSDQNTGLNMVSNENKQWLQDKIGELKNGAANTFKNMGVWPNLDQATQEIVRKEQLVSQGSHIRAIRMHSIPQLNQAHSYQCLAPGYACYHAADSSHVLF
jgi:hypothetical protein